MVQQLYRKMKRLYISYIFVFFCLMGCPFAPGTSPVPPQNWFLVVAENINCKFKISFKNVEGLVVDSLEQYYVPDSSDVFLLSPYNGTVNYYHDSHKSMRDQNNTGMKFYSFKKGSKLRAIVCETGQDPYNIIGNEYFCRLCPFGDNDFTDEEFATLLQRVDDYIDRHGGKWAKRASENDTVLILGNY